MKPKFNLLVASLLLATTSSALATVRYVNVNNANPTPPYTNWATAAVDIQSAVDAAAAGDEIVVTNGVYAGGSGGNPSNYGSLTCVVVDKALTLQSVDGPDVTVIDGGGWATCVYLTNDAVMVGFTLTNGSIGDYGGGVFCESTSAVLTNCVLSGNSAGWGGGAYGGTLNNCTLTGNKATAWQDDAGGYLGGFGGGADSTTLNNCKLTGNSASSSGGGACDCVLNNDTVTGNWAVGIRWKQGFGGGVYYSTLNNCTLAGNSASGYGGGACDCTLKNSIVFFNTAPSGANCYQDLYYGGTINYCCTVPMPTTGVGNISVDPQLASASHLSAGSPCIGAGSTTFASGTDIDGDAWNNPPSIGCDEYHAGALTGPLTLSLTVTYTKVATGLPVDLKADIEGRTDVSVWDFGDGDVQVNEPFTSHAWTAPGNYLVTLWAFNDSFPEGVSQTVIVQVVAELHYVAATGSNPVAPYTSWATAATNIQDAVDVASVPGATILVANGIYAAGGATDAIGNFDLVMVDKPLTIRSVNGPDVTVIDGGGASTCVYLTNNVMLVGFTLTNGAEGAYCESASAVLTNCVLTGSSGGGASGGTLNNCTVTGNAGCGTVDSTLNNCVVSANTGGGAYSDSWQPCTLNNCTVTGNSGWGASYATLNNCIVYFNSDTNGGNYDPSSTLNYCCTTPLPTYGVGNITNAPLFATYTNGNLRLQSNSPCINSGNNAYVVGSMDLDGNPRIQGGTVDIGAYEYQTPASLISYAWLQQYGLPINTNTDTADLDGTGMTVYHDWIAGLNPTNALSVLKMLRPAVTTNTVGLVVSWESVNTRTYYLQRSTNLAAQPAFITIQSNIVGQAGTMSCTDTNSVGSGPVFYRVGVSQ